MLSKIKHVGKKALIYTLFLGGVLSWNIFLAAEDKLSAEEVAFLDAFQNQVVVQEQIASEVDIGKQPPVTGPEAPNPTETPIPTEARYGVVLEDNLNVRSGPGTDFPVITKLYRNDEVRLMGEASPNGWWKIDLDGRPCYVKTEFIAPRTFSGRE